MINIIEIKSFVPKNKLDTYKKYKFKYDKKFFIEKIGTTKVTKVNNLKKDSVISMCVNAFKKLHLKKNQKIKAIILCTQNPDFNGLPHNSAIIQNELKKITKNIDNNVACFDISLGCSGYIYCLKTIESYLKENEVGLVFTCDLYSKIINPGDSNTEIIFGDAATVSLVKNDKKKTAIYDFYTDGESFKSLINNGKFLEMNGREVFNFCNDNVPNFLLKFLKKNNINKNYVKKFIFHQGSKYIVESLRNKINLKKSQVPIFLKNIGNTVSSSIPLTMEKYNIEKKDSIILCGYGVGLSISICFIN